MTCYRVNWKLTKEELDPIMYWLDENKEALGLIRGRADQGADRVKSEICCKSAPSRSMTIGFQPERATTLLPSRAAAQEAAHS